MAPLPLMLVLSDMEQELWENARWDLSGWRILVETLPEYFPAITEILICSWF